MPAKPNQLAEPGQPFLEVFEASDGYRFYYRRWPAQGTSRGRLVFIHGIQSHGGWYTRSCADFAAQGYEVFFLDRRGSGLNTSRRGDAPSFRRLLDDIAEFIQVLRAHDPRPHPEVGATGVKPLPLILGAISWGGKLGAALPYRHPGLIDGLVLFAPGLFARVSPPLTTRLLIGRSAVRAPTKMFNIPLNDPALFTADPHWRQYIAEDRFSLRQATGRFLFQSLSLDIYLRRAWKHIRIPVLLLLAGQDRVIDNSKVKKYIECLPEANRTIIDYPEAHHTLEFEPEPQPWRVDLLKWLAERRQ